MESDLKKKFYTTYNKIPLGIRDEVILVIDDDSVSWRIARLEVDNLTPLSQRILKKLAKLEII